MSQIKAGLRSRRMIARRSAGTPAMVPVAAIWTFPMTTFDEREQAFERRFVHDEERRFRVRTRRNLLLAGWACERMRLEKDAAGRFIESFTDRGVVTADEPLLEMLQAELGAAGIDETLRPSAGRWRNAPRSPGPRNASALRWIKVRPPEASRLDIASTRTATGRDAMTDKDLRRDVLDELDFDPSLDAAEIGVAVSEGVVTLTGHVGSYAEKVEAENAARRVKGVRAIAQEIQVRYAEAKKIEDDQIAARALAIIDWSVHLPKSAIQVKVAKGWITLTGAVPWQYQAMGAEAAVRKLSGVVGVSNLIEVRPEVRPTLIKDKILEAFKRGAMFEADSITVRVEGDKVTLEGAVTAWAERDAAERAAWSVPGVRAVEDRIVALS